MRLQASEPRLPMAFELTELLDKLLGDWAFLSIMPAGAPVAGPAELPLEFTAQIVGRVSCVLVLRSSHAFGAELAYASTGDPGAREQGADAFQELCNMLCSHVLTNFLGGDQGGFAPFLPQRSRPEQWPSDQADVASVVLVEDHPVEVRLWAAESLGERRG